MDGNGDSVVCFVSSCNDDLGAFFIVKLGNQGDGSGGIQ